MLTSDSDDVLVQSSIELGHDLGLAVVAEGVEDEVTLSALSALGCDVVQGCHLARPMPDQLATWLTERAPDPEPAGAAAPRDPVALVGTTA